MNDRKVIYLDDAIDAICKACSMEEDYHKCDGYPETSTWCDELVALRALPSAQPEERTNKRTETHACDLQPTCNQLATDTISRQAAIDELHGKDPSQIWDTADIEVWLNTLPSAQPEISCSEIPNSSDLISRQMLLEYIHGEPVGKLLCDKYNLDGLIEQLPSAQPEPLTDKEQRIFLAAMEREEKVCEEVDRNYVREPYEDSLARICHEITRKVKGALWTI